MPKQAETAASTSVLRRQHTRHMSRPRSSPNPRVVNVGGEQQLVILVPGHAPDLVWRSLNDIWLSVHLVEVIQAQLLFIACTPQLGFISLLCIGLACSTHSWRAESVSQNGLTPCQHRRSTGTADEAFASVVTPAAALAYCRAGAKASNQVAASNRIPTWQQPYVMGHQGSQEVSA